MPAPVHPVSMELLLHAREIREFVKFAQDGDPKTERAKQRLIEHAAVMEQGAETIQELYKKAYFFVSKPRFKFLGH